MRKNSLKTISFLLGFLVQTGLAYWEWTPQTGRWVNPKFAVRPTAREQFEVAEAERKAGRKEQAIREYGKVLKHFSRSEYAAPACLALAEIYTGLGDREKAFQYYQQLVTNYPESSLVKLALERQTAIAEQILTAKSNRFFDFLRGKEAKTKKMEQVIANNPYGEEVAERCYRLAEFYADIKQYDQAQATLEKLIRDFPGTRAAQQASYRLLEIEYLSIPEVCTDRAKYQQVQEQLSEFLQAYPNSPLTLQARQLQQRAAEQAAKKLYETAAFYERTGHRKAAFILYEKLVKEYPDSTYGAAARKKLALSR